MNKTKIILGMICLCCIASNSFAQSNSYSNKNISKRFERIEKDLRILNKEVYRNGVSPLSASSKKDLDSSKNADFEIRLSSLENNLRTIKGEIETIQYNNNLLTKTIEKLQKDINFRLNSIESKPKEALIIKEDKSKIDLSMFQKKYTPKKVITKSPVTSLSTEEQYSKAFNLLKEKEYDKAEKAFSKFIIDNKNHKLAGNAQYWLAETFYVRGNMQEAMKQFAYGYKNYKDSSKVRDNLLKLAITLEKIGRKDDACITLIELETSYKPLSQTIASRVENEKIKNKCSE